jgi:type II secretion system protein J
MRWRLPRTVSPRSSAVFAWWRRISRSSRRARARDTQGTGELQAAITATARDNTLVTFSTHRLEQPAGIQRPAEQRVRYRFTDGSLVRDHWLSVDPALNSEPRQRVVLTKVRSVEIRFLDPATRYLAK